MKLCICGRKIEGRSNRCSRCAALHEIGLEDGATDAEIKEAYRSHVKAWHPDRYADDKSQQHEAERKLKKVNAAYTLLTSPETILYSWPQSDTGPEPEPPPQEPAETNARRWQEAEPEIVAESSAFSVWDGSYPRRSASGDYDQWTRPIPRVWLEDDEAEADVVSPSPESESKQFKPTLIYAMLLVAIIVGTYFLATEQSKSPLVRHTGSSASSIPGATGANAGSGGNAQQAPPPVPEFFTLGSAKSDVIAVQGQPTSQDDTVLHYGLSTVSFQNDQVVGWVVFPMNPLKVILKPHSPPVSESGYFTLGSPTDVVISLEGTPTALQGNTMYYGESTVTTDGSKVIGWDSKPDNPLHVRLAPTSRPEGGGGTFAIGSSRDDVLALQGTPTSVAENTFSYGKSSVTFQNDKVSTWSVNASNPLHVQR